MTTITQICWQVGAHSKSDSLWFLDTQVSLAPTHVQYNLHEPSYNLHEPGYNLHEPGYNLHEPGYNLHEPGYNLHEPGYNRRSFTL